MSDKPHGKKHSDWYWFDVDKKGCKSEYFSNEKLSDYKSDLENLYKDFKSAVFKEKDASPYSRRVEYDVASKRWVVIGPRPKASHKGWLSRIFS